MGLRVSFPNRGAHSDGSEERVRRQQVPGREMNKGCAPFLSELASPRTPENIAADASLSLLAAAQLPDEMILDLEAQLRASEEGMTS